MQQTQDIIVSLLSLLIIVLKSMRRLLEGRNISIEDVFFMPQKGRIFRKFASTYHLRDIDNYRVITVETPWY